MPTLWDQWEQQLASDPSWQAVQAKQKAAAASSAAAAAAAAQRSKISGEAQKRSAYASDWARAREGVYAQARPGLAAQDRGLALLQQQAQGQQAQQIAGMNAAVSREQLQQQAAGYGSRASLLGLAQGAGTIGGQAAASAAKGTLGAQQAYQQALSGAIKNRLGLENEAYRYSGLERQGAWDSSTLGNEYLRQLAQHAGYQRAQTEKDYEQSGNIIAGAMGAGSSLASVAGSAASSSGSSGSSVSGYDQSYNSDRRVKEAGAFRLDCGVDSLAGLRGDSAKVNRDLTYPDRRDDAEPQKKR